jgi:protein-S-isoprenylcysteine O-methyltransferase Ste14
MNRRLLLALYPRDWRERYGTEVADLADELVAAGERTPRRAAVDLVAGAVLERWRVLTSRAVLVRVAAIGAAVGGVALVASRTSQDTNGARPYFDAHPVGVLLPVAELVWLLMELAEVWRGRHARRAVDRDTRRGRRRFWVAVAVCAAVVTVAVNVAPAAVPAAEIRPGIVAFTLGMVLLMVGLGLREWSFRALRGRYLNFSVVLSPDRPVVTTGPYRLLRHPGNAGILLTCTGIGLTSANWVGWAAITLTPLAMIIWRIRAEETALLTTLGEHYRRYADEHKRLVPMIW